MCPSLPRHHRPTSRYSDSRSHHHGDRNAVSRGTSSVDSVSTHYDEDYQNSDVRRPSVAAGVDDDDNDDDVADEGN